MTDHKDIVSQVSVTTQIKKGDGTLAATSVAENVVNGAVSVNFDLVLRSAATYYIVVSYNDSNGNDDTSTTSTHKLVVS